MTDSIRRSTGAAVVRVGLVQAAIGAIVVLLTSVINRVMIVELGLAASLPGMLIAMHFAVQMLFRPQVGHWSDQSARRAPWIVAGMALLVVGAVGAAASTGLIASAPGHGVAVAVLAFVAVGAGASLAGTPLLALLSEGIDDERRPRAAATVWLMMIAGFVWATVTASVMLERFSQTRLMVTVATISLAAAAVAVVAVTGLEGRLRQQARRKAAPAPRTERQPLRDAIAAIWRQPQARTFTVFILVSMLAYSAQDLILEPFGGLVFGMSPAESTRLSSTHQGGMLIGMIGGGWIANRAVSLRRRAWAGCLGSALAFVALAATPASAGTGAVWVIVPMLGVANGVFAVGAVGSMLSVTMADGDGRAGIRMGVFGAAQALASAIGGPAGAVASDLFRAVLGSAATGYAAVFVVEAALFGVAAALALRSIPEATPTRSPPRLSALPAVPG